MNGAFIATLAGLAFVATVARAADPLPSWNGTGPKQAIVAFAGMVIGEG